MRDNKICELEVKFSSYAWIAAFLDCRVHNKTRFTDWVTSFHPDRLACRLVCDTFDEDYHGSHNWGVQVIFPETEESWMIRFVRHGYVALPDEKVEREVAAINLVRQHTDIPVPEIKAWGLSHDNVLECGPFIMFSFVEGKDLGEILGGGEDKDRSLADSVDENTLEKIYRQVARFQLQLASLNFSQIGSLSTSA
jgi:hypothetical protein